MQYLSQSLKKLRQPNSKSIEISWPLEAVDIEVHEVRQPVRYAHLFNLYRRDKKAFADYIRPPCALPGSKKVLTTLFEHRSINWKLLRIFKFCGLAKHCTWTTLENFSELSTLVPQELERKLDQLALFWEEILILAERSDDIYRDEDTSSKISGLWPSKSTSDMRKLHKLAENKKFFSSVTNPSMRKRIVNRLQTLEYRIPTFSLLVSESRALLQLATWIDRTLLTMGRDSCLQSSRLIWKGHLADEHQYLRCFLIAARTRLHKNDQALAENLRHIFEALDPTFSPPINVAIHEGTSSFRRVSAYPNGIWSSFPLLSQFFDERVLTAGSRASVVEFELPVVWLLQDFFRSFFGAGWLSLEYQKQPTVFGWRNKEYYPFILDIPPTGNPRSVREVLWGEVGDFSELEEPLDNIVGGDVRRRAGLIVGTRVQSSHSSVENARLGQFSAGEDFVRIDTVRQQSYRGTTKATDETFTGTRSTASSDYDKEHKAVSKSPGIGATVTSAKDKAQNSPDTAVNSAISVSDYQFIIENEMKEWTSSGETLLGVDDTYENAQRVLNRHIVEQSERALDTDDIQHANKRQSDRNTAKAIAEEIDDKRLRPGRSYQRSTSKNEWSSGDETVIEVDSELVRQVDDTWDVQAQRKRLHIGLVHLNGAFKLVES